MERGLSPVTIAVLVASLGFAGIILVAWQSYRMIDRELTTAALSRRAAVSDLAAGTLAEKFDHLIDIGISLATRVRFRQLVAAGKWTEAIEILRDVPRNLPVIERVFLADAAGTLMADVPELPGVRGRSFAHRDWYKGVSREGKAYVSPVYQRAAAPQANVFAVAVPIRTDGGDISGILVLQVRVDTFFEWLKAIEIGAERFVYVVDPEAQLAFHSKAPGRSEIDRFSAVPATQRVLRGVRGVEVAFDPVEGGDAVSAYSPVSGHRWGVVVQEPASAAFRTKHEQLRYLLVAYGLVLLFWVLVAYLVFRIVSQGRRAQQAIRQQNELLEQRVRERTTQLRDSEAQLRTVFENLEEGVAVSGLDGRLLYFNRAAIEMFGFASRDEYLRALPEFADTLELSTMDGAILPVEQWPLARVLRGETLRDLEMGTRAVGNRHRRIFSYGGTLARDTSGEPLLAVITIRDVTERRQAERRIRGQLEHLSLLDEITRSTGERLDLKSIFQIVLVRLEDSLPIDFGCVCLYDAAAKSLQVTCVGAKSEALARELTMDEQAAIAIDANGLARCIQGQLVYEPDLGEVRFPFPERLAGAGLGSLVMAPLRSESRVFGVLVAARHAAHAFSSAECEFLRQLSEHVALAAHQAQLYTSLQQAYDDLRQTQAAAMQEERLRALGQMASGIAHDINNALSPVSLYVESMLETERELSERGRGYLETIQRAVEDVAQTVARLREFYRQRERQLELAPVQVNDLVQQVVDFTRARWNDMPLSRGIVIRVVRELAPELPQVMGVESEIREALTNLVFNAVDAMPEGGTLTLRTRLAEAGTQHAVVVVEVSDSGAGMDEETRRRCLEPFFTTKGERGTGLGLAMVFGIVQRHSAGLEIDSAPGAGTTVRLLFGVPAPVQVDTAQPAAAPAAPSRLRLLLIDDDPILLKSLRDALETDGHVIVTANGGEAGVAAFRASLERGEPFAAVITDLGMPYVDGRRVASAVKEASPAAPVIMLTGWGQRLIDDGDIPAHVDRVLAKPPKLREVRAALAQLCSAAAQEPAA